MTNLLVETMTLKGNSIEAEKQFNRSLMIAKQLGYPINISDAAKNLQQLYRSQSQWQQALEMNDARQHPQQQQPYGGDPGAI